MSKAVKPGGDCKSTTYWAAVLLLDKDLLSPKLEEDFLWVKCKHVCYVEPLLLDKIADRSRNIPLIRSGSNTRTLLVSTLI
jgi:hypothetical protein